MTNSIIEDTETHKKLSDKLHGFTSAELKGLTSDDFQRLIRLSYLKTFSKPLPNYCPECGAELTTTEDEDETICTGCGLITSMSIEYVANTRIILPYGRH